MTNPILEPKALINFQRSIFSEYASYSSNGITHSIGVSGNGNFVVFNNGKKEVFLNPQQAVKRYTDLILPS